MLEADTPLALLDTRRPPLPQWVLGTLGLVSGVIALTSVVVESASWMKLGAALVIWILSGWAIYFGGRPRQSPMARLGALLLISAAAAALAVLSGVYLRVLGPSWIL